MHVQTDVMFILASASVRRQELLSLTGLDFSVAVPDIDESKFQKENVRELAELLAYEKALKVASQFNLPSVVISADTLIRVDERILGKPLNMSQAGKMLMSMSGKSHDVITGLCVNCKFKNQILTRSLTTKVYFKPLSEKVVEDYILRNNPMDWAGSYAIQGTASMFIKKIDGDFFNVVGLPLTLLYDMLLEIGYDLLTNTWITS